MSCTVYTMNCNFVIHAICSLTLKTYEYNDLQVSFATQKLCCKASCKTTHFFHSVWKTMHCQKLLNSKSNSQKSSFIIFQPLQRFCNFINVNNNSLKQWKSFINNACVAFSFEASTPNKSPSYFFSIWIDVSLQCGTKNCETFMKSGRMNSSS